LIPIESKQLNTPLSISARITKKKGITPTNNPISNDLKQINMPNFTYTKSKITFLYWLSLCFAGNIYSQSFLQKHLHFKDLELVSGIDRRDLCNFASLIPLTRNIKN
jgi:hypothetical protein